MDRISIEDDCDAQPADDKASITIAARLLSEALEILDRVGLHHAGAHVSMAIHTLSEPSVALRGATGSHS